MNSMQRAATILERLREEYGEPERGSSGDAVTGLVGTILSQSTSDINSERALARLRAEFPTWDEVLQAPLQDVADAIRAGGLADQKAQTIQRALRAIAGATGALAPDFLDAFDDEEAMSFLQSIKGVGQKTAACVLLFDLERDVLPVDTHVHRVCRRLGLVPDNATANQTQPIVEALIADEERFAAHILLITHGRSICHARVPKCGLCVLFDICEFPERVPEERVA